MALTERGLPSLAEVLKKPADYIDKYVVWRVTPGKIVSKRGFLAKVDDKPVFIFLDETMPDAATFARGTRLRVEGYVREASRLSLQPSATAGDFAAVKGAQFYLHVLGPTPPEAKKSSKSRPSLDSPGGAILARYGPLLPGGEAFQRR
ncbi:MAG: hypothetical protein FJX76_16715 [Armatimonadetes bacterium]|nr:hypothetical protein [Armatimonadota bacterium]